MFGTIVSPHMVNIVHRVFFFPFLIQNEKKKALALVAPRCVVLAIHHLHLQSQIPIDMKKKKKKKKRRRRRPGGGDCVRFCTTPLTSKNRHEKKKNRGSVHVLHFRVQTKQKRERSLAVAVRGRHTHTHVLKRRSSAWWFQQRRNSTVNFIPPSKKDTSSSSSYQILFFLLTTGKRIYILSMSRGSRTMNLKMSL